MQKSFGLLKEKKGVIFGALDQNSIAWKTAERIYEEGGRFVLTNLPLAIRFGSLDELSKKCEAKVFPADATSTEDLENLFEKAKKEFGKIDFILHSPAMSNNIRKKRSYGDLNYDWYIKTIDVSALSFHKVMHIAEKSDIMNEWGSILAISYIAAQRSFPGYTDMSDAKAMLESIARNFGYRFAKNKKVRVNTISQSPTKTTAASGIDLFDVFYEYAEKMSPLGNANNEDFANYAVMMFSDFTRKITMQNLMNDGGFSTCGINEKLIDVFQKSQEEKTKI